MSEQAIHQRLRQARIARGESQASLAKRIGVRVDRLCAIEQGRFHDLSAGIYARGVIRAYADAVGLNATEILTISRPLLPDVEDPLSALRRLHGIHAKAPVTTTEHLDIMLPSWRPVVASAIDAAAIAALLLIVVASTLAMGVPLRTVGSSTWTFVLMTMVLAASYFVTFGGIAGRTLGECVIGTPAKTDDRPLDLWTVARRTRDSVLRDAGFIESTGRWIGHRFSDHGLRGRIGHWVSLITNH